jgi:hypothetical protein
MSIRARTFLTPLAGALLLTLAACSSEPAALEKKEAAKPPEPITGQSALYKMYQVARSQWAPDAQVLKLDSMHLAEVPEVPGKAPAWEATFTSANLSRSRTYTYSVIEEQPNLHQGVFAGNEENFSGSRGVTKPFPIAAVKIDTDAAYQTAHAKAADYEKKNPGKPITILLENNDRFPDPAWRIIWGESVGTSSFSVFVDASTGAYLETMH